MRPPGNVFEFLDEVRRRPRMFMRSWVELESQLFGYAQALRAHDLIEVGPSMSHFGDWLEYRTGWSLSCGWAYALEAKESDEVRRLERFFGFVDEFRRLETRILARAALAARHGATGRRRAFGFGVELETPVSLEVVQYAPEPLHLIRMRYESHAIETRFSEIGEGTEQTSCLEDALSWCEDEFLVTREDWDRL